jgi:hypothetical protein
MEYAYFLSCVGAGAAASTVLSDDNAYGRASARADENLKRVIAEGAVVPCPNCGWLQARMKILAREQTWDRVPWFGLVGVVLILSSIVSLLLGCFVVVLVLFPPGLLSLSLDLRRRLQNLQPIFPFWPRAPKPGLIPAWTRPQLEKLARDNPRINMSDPLLDWESQKIRI